MRKTLTILSCVLMVASLSADSRLPTGEQLKAVQQKRALQMKLKAAVERPMKAAQVKLNREKLEVLKETRRPEAKRTEKERLLRTLRSSGVWKRFVHRGSHPGRPLYRTAGSTENGPTVLINGDNAATIAAGESFEISITFSTGEDSALAEVFFDVDGDTVVDAEDISLLEVLTPGPKMKPDEGPEGPFWLYDNLKEDENSAAGEFETTIDDFPFMGISMIFRATDGGGSGQAYLTVENLTGDYTATGTVSPVTAPALVMFSHEFEDDPFMTFTNSSGAFSFDFLNLEGGFFLGAMDAALGISSGEHLMKGHFYENPDELDGVALDITRDAAIVGSVVDDEDGTGIEDASVAAFIEFWYDILMGYSVSDADGDFSIPLQGGHMYDIVEAYHPDYLWDSCIDYPIYVASGDTLDFDCELEPWPAFVEGYVKDADTEEPLEDMAVEIRMWDGDHGEPGMMGDGDDGPMDGFYNEVWTDGDGYYRLGTIYGTGELCAHDWDDREYQGYCEFDFLVDESLVQYDFLLEPFDGAIAGTVTDESTGDPLPDAEVWAYSEEWMFDGWDMTGDDGEYELPVENGTYTVCAEKWNEGYREECVDNVVVTGNIVTIDIALSPTDGVIQGYVYNADTEDPVEGLGVDAYGNEFPHNYYYSETDESGFFKLGVHNGSYEVCFYDWTNTYEDTCLMDIVVSDDTQEIDVYLIPFDWDGAMAGTVSDEYGNPIISGVVAVDTTQWEGNWTMSDRDGGYVLPLNNGTYESAAFPFRRGYLWDFAHEVEVDSDTTDVDFNIPIVQIDAMIDGTVTDSLGNSLGYAWVEAATWSHFDEFDWKLAEEGVFFDTETDESGKYELDVMGFADRYYWVYADYWDPETGELMVGGVDSVSVLSGDTVSVDVELRPIVYSSEICGNVTIDGEPVEGAEVEAEDYDTGDYFVTYTDEDGYFCMGGVFNGDYDVCATIDDYMMICSYVEVYDEGESADFEFSTVTVTDEALLPERYALHQNRPNPFNPVTTIQYDLPQDGIVELVVYDILGHEVAVLVDGRQGPGYHAVQWDGTNRSGREVATGVYIYQLKSGDFVRTRKLILLR